MTNLKRFVMVLVLVGLAGGVMAAKEKRRRRGPVKENFLEALTRECKLTDKQHAAIKAKITARDEAMAKWDKANAKKIEASAAASKEARTSGDADKKKQAGAAARELRNARTEAGAETTAAVLKELTPAQKTAWGGYQLFKSLSGRYRRAELNEAQLAKVKAACAFAAKDIAAIDPDDNKAKKIKGEVTKKLQWAINVLVLTEDQRKILASSAPKRGGKKKDQQ
jgi:hypothetical protein